MYMQMDGDKVKIRLDADRDVSVQPVLDPNSFGVTVVINTVESMLGVRQVALSMTLEQFQKFKEAINKG